MSQPVTIRPATPEDREHVSAVLPAYCLDPQRGVVLVAVGCDAGEILAAAAVGNAPRGMKPVGAPIVFGAQRAGPSGRAGPSQRAGPSPAPVPFTSADEPTRLLIEAAADLARQWGRGALYTWTGVPRGSAQAQTLERLGFAVKPAITHYLARLDAYDEVLTAIHDRLRRHHRIPDAAQIIPLREAPIGEIVHYHTLYIGGETGRLAERLRGGGARPFDADLSRVLMLDGRVCAFLLVRLDDDGVLVAEARVVVPRWRNKWVNTLLMYETLRNARQVGQEFVRFLANERQWDTHRLAARLKPPALEVHDVYARSC